MVRSLLALAIAVGTTAFALANRADQRAAAADKGGFTSLFNGRDLTGWKGDTKYWAVRDGAITGQSSKDNLLPHNTFLVWQGGDLRDFELRVTCRITGNNSGIQYRSKLVDEEKFVVHGYQADFGPGESHNGKLYDEGGRAALAYPGQKVIVRPDGKLDVVGSFGDPERIKKGIPEDTWVEYIIIARGNRVIHEVDGQTMIDVTDEQADKRTLSGLLALQIHGGDTMTVQFKDLRLKSLPPVGKQ